MKKIVRVITRLCIAGPSIHTTLLSGYFNNKNWKTKLLHGSLSVSEGDMSFLVENYKADAEYFDYLGREVSLKNDIIAVYKLYKYFKKEKPDIVHAHLAKAGTIARTAAWLAGVPQIYYTFHGHVFNGYFSPLKTKIFIVIERLMAMFCTNIITISDKLKQDLIDYKICKAHKIKVIPLGFDFSRVIPLPEHKDVLRKRLGIGEETVIVAIIGRICPIKNHKFFFEIASEIIKQRKNVHFLVIGDGELRKECEEQVKLLNLNNCLTFTGFISDIQLVYGSVDIVALTSISEGTPVSLIEAMVSKKLVITTNVGGVSDFIDHGKTGFYYDFDKERFCDTIINYVDDRSKFEQIQEEAYLSIIDKFDKQRLFNDLEKLYSGKL